jgi:flavodoxin I
MLSNTLLEKLNRQVNLEAGSKVAGYWPAETCEFSSSKALRDGMFVGLALDADNQEHMTGERIRKWLCSIRPFLS